MHSLIAAAARALAAGDALGALKRIALRGDAPALALRGIAMAQLGEHSLARALLRRAARSFGTHEVLARARCVVAEAEVALAMRDFGGSTRSLAEAAATLEARADRANALLGPADCGAPTVAARAMRRGQGCVGTSRCAGPAARARGDRRLDLGRARTALIARRPCAGGLCTCGRRACSCARGCRSRARAGAAGRSGAGAGIARSSRSPAPRSRRRTDAASARGGGAF